MIQWQRETDTIWNACYGGVQVGLVICASEDCYWAMAIGMGRNGSKSLKTLEEAQAVCERACMEAISAIVEATVRIPHKQQALF